MLVTAEVKVKIPQLPNYLLIESKKDEDPQSISISAISDEDLKNIGIDWTNQLIGKAQKIRMKETN